MKLVTELVERIDVSVQIDEETKTNVYSGLWKGAQKSTFCLLEDHHLEFTVLM